MPRLLPPLATLFPNGPKLPPSQTQTFALLNALRRIARQLRGTVPQPFYTTREIAAFFGVPKTTVVRVYGELQMEGWLVRLRSSVTMLAAVHPQPRHPVRGVVGLPVWRPGYVQLPDWQMFFTEMENQLRHHGFVADLIFYSGGEDTLPEFGDRLLAHDLDALLWYRPHPNCLPLMSALTDAGVRVFLVTNPGYDLPYPRYEQSYYRAVAQGLMEWKRRGLKAANFLRAVVASYEDARWRQITQQAGLTPTLLGERDWPAFVRRRRDSLTDGLVCVDDQWLSKFPPAEMLRLLRTMPVMFLHRPMLATLSLAGLRADVVCHDWPRIAHRIADDLAAAKPTKPGIVATFEAEWFPRTDLASFHAAL